MGRLDGVALEKWWEKKKNVGFWMWKTRSRVRCVTRLGVRISRRMSQTHLLYRENLVNEDLELAEDMQFLEDNVTREKQKIEPSADQLWWRDGRETSYVDQGPSTSTPEAELLRFR